MNDILLTHGNIRKSKMLKYMVTGVWNSDSEGWNSDAEDEMNGYLTYAQNLPFFGLSDVYPYLHDANIWFTINENDLTMRFWSDYFEDEIGIISGSFKFSDAKMFGAQRVLKSGHIGRFNKSLKNLTFIYSEFYKFNTYYYLTLVVNDNKWPPYKTGISDPLVTIKFKNLVVERD